MLKQIIQSSAATVEPVTVNALAWNLRLTADPDEDYTGVDLAFLEGLITAARVDAENYTGRHIAGKTYEKTFRSFLKVLPLTANVLTVDAVSYLDAANTSQSVDAANFFPYLTDMTCGVEFAGGYSLPVAASRNDAITVSFTVGMATVERPIVQAIIMQASHWYENRESANYVAGGEIKTTPFAYGWLLDSYRIHTV